MLEHKSLLNFKSKTGYNGAKQYLNVVIGLAVVFIEIIVVKLTATIKT